MWILYINRLLQKKLSSLSIVSTPKEGLGTHSIDINIEELHLGLLDQAAGSGCGVTEDGRCLIGHSCFVPILSGGHVHYLPP